MINYSKNFEVLWVDVDLNGHLQHTAYSRYATNVRVGFFKDYLGTDFMDLNQEDVGPIIIREFIEYKKEVRLSEIITIDLTIAGVTQSYSRWLIRHHIYVHGEIACIINIEGSWLHLKRRKMVLPGDRIKNSFDKILKTEDFKVLGRRDRLSMKL